MNKKNVLIICGTLILAIALGVVLFLVLEKNDKNVAEKNKPQDFEEFLATAIDEINELNSVLTSENVSDTNSYENENGFMCKNYIGDDEKNIIDRLNNLYHNPFEEDGYFELIENEETGEEDLYVCLPEGCTPKVLDYATGEIIIDEEDENSRYVNFGGAEYGANLYDGKWKFTFPVTICSLNFLINEENTQESENN